MKLRVGGILLAFGGCCGSASAGPPQEQTPVGSDQAVAAAVLEKAIGKQGGRVALAKIRHMTLRSLAFVVHGQDGRENQGTISLKFRLPAGEEPDRLWLKLDAGGIGRNLGFDGERHWSYRANPEFKAYLSPDRPDDGADIARIDEARDVLRALFLPALEREGTPFESRGRYQEDGKEDGRWRHVLAKKDANGRALALHVWEDGEVYLVRRTETGVDKDKDGKPFEWARSLVVFPSGWVAVEGVRLPTKLEIKVERTPFVDCQIQHDEVQPGFHFKPVDDRVFKLPP
ncbi:MAG: hypothetical protein L0216_02415 [Planctomycetales bacterium]|nr:hypothetical protein [Planctomycetales bacterium]